jgi:hypothetical protein
MEAQDQAMHVVNGACHCGNIRVEAKLTRAPSAYTPRSCDCDYCRKHGAAWLSDAQGSLIVHIKKESEARHYRQGSGTADLLLCGKCGNLVGVFYQGDARLFGAINARIIDGGVHFAPEQSVSPKRLSPDAKAARWQEIWFSQVRVNIGE